MALTVEEMGIIDQRVNIILENTVYKKVEDIVTKKIEEKNKIIAIGRIELNELKEIVKSLAIEQSNTKVEINDLKGIVKELAEAQKRTEVELQNLIKEHNKTRTQLGGISDSVGFPLEDKGYIALPTLLKRDFGIIVKSKLKRQWITDNKGKSIEINIIGEASGNGQNIMIIGESKSQLSKNKVDDFIRKKLNRLKGVFKKIFPLMITYMISESDVENYAKQKGIALYYSYDFSES